jgi:hypothetical protein
MVIGLCRLELVVYEAVSLKDKRRVIRSIKDRVWRRFRVAIAEVGELDSRQRVTLGVAMVSNDARVVHEQLAHVVGHVRSNRTSSMVDYHIEVLENL